MGKVFLVFTLFCAPAMAEWTAVVNCENGGFVIDENKYQCRYGTCQNSQVVIRNQSAVKELLRTGAIDKTYINAAGELIIPEVLFNTDAPTAVVTLKRFSVDEVKTSGFAFILGFLKKGPDNTFELKAVKANPYPTERPEVASWVFRNCR